jgi:hypothetical protein
MNDFVTTLYKNKLFVVVCLIFLVCLPILVFVILTYNKVHIGTISGVKSVSTDYQKFAIQPLEVATTKQRILDDNIEMVDGYLMRDGDLVLVKNQDNTSENGVYVKEFKGLRRYSEFDQDDMNFFYIENGETNNNKVFASKTKNGVQAITLIVGNVFGDNIELKSGTIPIVGPDGKWGSTEFYLYNLQDVGLANVSKDHVLLHNGTNWVNSPQNTGIDIDIDLSGSGGGSIIQINVNNNMTITEENKNTKMFIVTYTNEGAYEINLPKITQSNNNTLYYFLKTSVLGVANIRPAVGNTIISAVELNLSSLNDYVTIRANNELSSWIFE